MKATSLSLRVLTLFAFLLLSTGCVKAPPPAQPPAQEQQPSACAPEKNILPADTEMEAGHDDHSTTCPDARTIQASERSRANCYHLQPGATITKKKGHHTDHAVKATKGKGKQPAGAVTKTKQKKGPKTTRKTQEKKKKGKQKTGQEATPPSREEYQTTGMCQPQSLIYARCRTGFNTCRLGNTSPVQWFACAKKNRATASIPTAGSVMVLDVNTRRGMPTGHPAYVEEVKKNTDGTWTLRITHTNYDRKCHLDLDATVLFDPKHMAASFQSGPWGPWAKDLKVLGFILR